MTLVIIILSAIVSIFALNDASLMRRLQFNAYQVRHSNEYYRFFTYAFVHADWIHMAVNLYVLYSFGEAVEMFYGVVFPGKAGFYYVLLYVGGILFSTLASYPKQNNNPYYNAVGASGAVSAVVFTSILFYPAGKIGFLFLPFDIPSVVFGVLYLVYSAYMARRGSDNIGHDAHFWGAIFGIVFNLALKPSLGAGFLWKVAAMAGF